MFYYIEGAVAHLDRGTAVVDAGGVGFLLNVSAHTLAKLELGKKARLYTYFSVREDAFDLFGFSELAEKRSFELLIAVSGVGPKAALSILSTVTPDDLALAVLSEDEKTLTRAPGVGKRIAQRIVLELKDKIAKESLSLPAQSGPPAAPVLPGSGKALAEATAALTVLGYSQQEITLALRGIQTEGMTTEELIRTVLKQG